MGLPRDAAAAIALESAYPTTTTALTSTTSSSSATLTSTTYYNDADTDSDDDDDDEDGSCSKPPPQQRYSDPEQQKHGTHQNDLTPAATTAPPPPTYTQTYTHTPSSSTSTLFTPIAAPNTTPTNAASRGGLGPGGREGAGTRGSRGSSIGGHLRPPSNISTTSSNETSTTTTSNGAISSSSFSNTSSSAPGPPGSAGGLPLHPDLSKQRSRPQLVLPKDSLAFISPFPTPVSYQPAGGETTGGGGGGGGGGFFDRPRTATSIRGASGGGNLTPGTPKGEDSRSGGGGVTSYFSLPLRSVSRKKSTSHGSGSGSGLRGLGGGGGGGSGDGTPGTPGIVIGAGIPHSQAKAYEGGGSSLGLSGKMFAGGKGGQQVVQSPNAMYENVHDIATKRIATLDYLRRAHEGRVYWFNTVFFSKQDLIRNIYNEPKKLGRRSTNYFILGISIPNILDLGTSSPLDYLRGFHQLLSEYESYLSHASSSSSSSDHHHLNYSHAAPSSTRRLPKLFSRSSREKPRRGSSAASTVSNWSSSPEITLVGGNVTVDGLERVRSSSGGAGSISGPIPLSHEDSGGLMSLLSPSGNTLHATPSLAGTGLGTPGIDNEYSFLSTPSLPFEPDFFETFATLCDVLIDAYSRVLSLVASPEMCAPGVGEMFVKADLKVRKLVIGQVVREVEEAARGQGGVRGELAGLGKVVWGGLM